MRADERQDFITAQRYYLQSIEYLIPAIQYEKDPKKKQEIREKAKNYIQRAEHIASLNKPTFPRQSSAQSSSLKTQNSETSSGNSSPQPSQFISSSPLTASTLTSSIDSLDNIQILLSLCKDNQKLSDAIQICADADATLNNSFYNLNYADLFSKYQQSIAVLLNGVKMYPKESDFSRLLKIYIDKWLSKAELLKAKLTDQNNMQIMQANENFKEEDDNVSYYKQCLIQ